MAKMTNLISPIHKNAMDDHFYEIWPKLTCFWPTLANIGPSTWRNLALYKPEEFSCRHAQRTDRAKFNPIPNIHLNCIFIPLWIKYILIFVNQHFYFSVRVGASPGQCENDYSLTFNSSANFSTFSNCFWLNTTPCGLLGLLMRMARVFLLILFRICSILNSDSWFLLNFISYFRGSIKFALHNVR